MCERMLEYESLIKIEYKDSFVCPIIIFFVQDIKGIYRSVLKTIAIHDEMSSFRYFRIGLK